MFSDTYFTYIQDEFIDWLIVSWLTSSDTYFTYIQDEFIDWLIVSWLTFSDTYFTYIQDEFIDVPYIYYYWHGHDMK